MTVEMSLVGDGSVIFSMEMKKRKILTHVGKAKKTQTSLAPSYRIS